MLGWKIHRSSYAELEIRSLKHKLKRKKPSLPQTRYRTDGGGGEGFVLEVVQLLAPLRSELVDEHLLHLEGWHKVGRLAHPFEDA